MAQARITILIQSLRSAVEPTRIVAETTSVAYASHREPFTCASKGGVPRSGSQLHLLVLRERERERECVVPPFALREKDLARARAATRRSCRRGRARRAPSNCGNVRASSSSISSRRRRRRRRRPARELIRVSFSLSLSGERALSLERERERDGQRFERETRAFLRDGANRVGDDVRECGKHVHD